MNSSDTNTAMLAKKVFDGIVEQVQSSNLNFQLQLSPFSATIFLKKSFVRDKLGNMLLPSINVNRSDNNNLFGEIDHLKCNILEIEEDNKTKDNTIRNLEEKLRKTEASATKAFTDKNEEVNILKTSLKNANKEIDILKNNVKSQGKIVKDTEKDLYKLDRKYDVSEANLKKCMEENNVLKSKNKKLFKKLNQKSKKNVDKNMNDENDNPTDDIFSKMQECANNLPSLLHISPGKKCSSQSTDPPDSTLPLSPLLATATPSISSESASSASVPPQTPPRTPPCTTPDCDASGSSLTGIAEEANNPESIATVQAKLREVREAGKKLDFESLVVLLKNHPWEDSDQQFENEDEYDAFEYETYPDEYEEITGDEENDEPCT